MTLGGHDTSIVHPTGLFTRPDSTGAMRLLGSQCDDCGQRMFPRRVCCVSCYSRNLKDAALESTGKVDCFTIVRQAPPGYEGPVPYVLAMVLLGNGVHVLSHLTGKPPNRWRIGDTVAACVLCLREADAERPAILSHAFCPASATALYVPNQQEQ